MALLLLTGGTISIVGGAAYLLGLFDRPTFTLKKSLFSREVCVIVTTCTEKDIGANIVKLMESTSKVVESLPNSKEMRENVAKLYGMPGNSLIVGFYFDNPNTNDKPRWAIGIAVDGTYEEVCEMVNKLPSKTDAVKVVRIGMNPILKARIPYRSRLTLSIVGPMIQWKRAFDVFKKGEFEADNGRNIKDEGAVAIEVCAMNQLDQACKVCSLDYVVLMGDTTVTWDDAFPQST